METDEKSVPKDKFELRRYLERLDLRDSRSLEERASEIFYTVERVMNPYYIGERGRPLQVYYLPCKNLIDNAYEKRDFENDIPFALGFLKDSLEWE